jgi:hypothetical protein
MSSLGYSDFNGENNDTNNPIQKKREGMRHNKTAKKRQDKTTTNPKLEAMMNRIHEDVEDEDGESDINNYQPLSPPNSVGTQRMENQTNGNSSNDVNDDNMDHDINDRIESQYKQSQQLQHPPRPRQQKQVEDNTQEAFTQLPSEYAKQYYQQYIPYYNQSSDDMSPSGTNKDELLTKLNQIIYLLEEQQEEKTDNVMEELILYSFLGIFIIFIVDSFARAGKYVR